ncbi:hypothetical protein BGX28_002794 [Mortierella sp. GBA30]|nr:hypothetical protein BGX28_002794 [Mortierella sp. GBA30]
MDEDQHCIGLSEQDQPHNSLKRGSSDTLHSPAVKRGSSCFTQGSAKSSFSRSLPRKNGQGFSLKASHELREAGQSHKFKDEIEYIMDGLRTKDSLRIRRTRSVILAFCLELTRSMLKDDFTDQVRAHQYMPAIVEATHTDHDPIVLSCLALMIGVTLQNTNAYKDTVAINDLIPFLCASLQVDLDPMAMMPAGRQEIALFNDFKDLARQSGILRKGQKVLTKSILLSSIASVIQESVSSNDTQTLSLIEQDQQFLSTILQTLVEDLAWIKEPSSTPDVSLPDVLDIGRIEHCLCILERLAMVSGRPAAALASNTRLFPLLVQLVALCRAHAFQYPRETDTHDVTKIQSETDHGSGEEHLEDGVIENDTNGWYDILLLSPRRDK